MTLLLHISVEKSWCSPELTPLAPHEWKGGRGSVFVFFSTQI